VDDGGSSHLLSNRVITRILTSEQEKTAFYISFLQRVLRCRAQKTVIVPTQDIAITSIMQEHRSGECAMPVNPTPYVPNWCVHNWCVLSSLDRECQHQECNTCFDGCGAGGSFCGTCGYNRIATCCCWRTHAGDRYGVAVTLCSSDLSRNC